MPEQQEHNGLRLLSLDGGGIRGLSELLILQEIMKRIQSQDKLQDTPRPCDYFDLIGGTSTGGIIGLMLGRLRMSVTEAIHCYGTLAEEVFSNRKRIFGDGKFKASKLERVIKKIVKERTGEADEPLLDTRPEGDICKAFVCAMSALNMSAGIPHLFRTYPAPKHETFNCTIWEASRATSAAPTFFKRIEIGRPGSMQPYVDGGMGCNNPIAQVLEEAEVIFPGREVACIISIGTGHPRTISIPQPNWLQQVLPLNVLQAIKGIATDCERSAEAVAQRFKGVSNIYFRFNVTQGLQNIGLEQWERLDEVTAHTEQYMRATEVDQKLAAAVVAIRERQKVISTAHINGRIQLSAGQKHTLKRCPPPTPVFMGRQNILDSMREYFFNDVGKRHVFVLYGLGGAGKSQLAFKFIEACQIEIVPSRFSDVFYIDGSTSETMSGDLESIALAKGIGESMKDGLDWLTRCREEWLLLFNNADDAALNLRDYFPQCSHGNILITSRNRSLLLHASSPRSNCQVSGMETNDASSLLLKVAGFEEHDEENASLAESIVKEFDRLALAVVQGGAYISNTQCGLKRYLNMYRERRASLFQDSHEDVQKIDDYQETVYTTWKISFDKLSDGATSFLQLCAFLHHDGITEAIFRNAAVNLMTYRSEFPVANEEFDSLNKAKEFLGSFGSSEQAWNVQKFFKVISEIRSYSLIDFDSANETYSIHPLVHSWTQTTISKSDVFRDCVKFILGVSIVWRFNLEDYAFRRALVPHVDMVFRDGRPTCLCVFTELGLVYSEAGRWKDAEELRTRIMEAARIVLGGGHPFTLVSAVNLAATYHSQGRLKEAEKLLVLAKEMLPNVLGEEGPETLKVMTNLAATYHSQGRFKEAEDLEVQVKNVMLRVFGPEHPETLRTMANLAASCRNQGRWKEAEALEIQVMEARRRLLGVEHPDTLLIMGNLACTYRDEARLKEAEDLQTKVWEISLKMFGPAHPDTLKAMTNLAATYRVQGRWKEAEALEIQVNQSNLRMLGAEHPQTLSSMSNLASTYIEQRRWKEAEELLLYLKQANMKVLGDEHLDTLRSLGNVASIYLNQGQWEEAEKLEVQVKETTTRVLGPEHPDTLGSMVRLATLYQNRERWKEAEDLGIHAMKTMQRVLGPEHPHTLTSMGNLATTYHTQGRLKEAEELDLQVKEATRRVLGPEHPETLMTMKHLAGTYRSQGRWEDAEPLYFQVQEISPRVFGAEHPETLISMGNLALAYWNLGRVEEAEALLVRVKEVRLRVLGPEHPDTLRSKAMVTTLYRAQERVKELEDLEDQFNKAKLRTTEV